MGLRPGGCGYIGAFATAKKLSCPLSLEQPLDDALWGELHPSAKGTDIVYADIGDCQMLAKLKAKLSEASFGRENSAAHSLVWPFKWMFR